MIEMTGADAFFLYEATPACHMHTLKIIVVDPSTAHHGIDFTRVRNSAVPVMLQERAFRRVPVAAPFGMGRPSWREETDLDPDYHVRHAVLDPANGEAGLDALAGRIASEPLDPKRPLWQLTFVEGLPGGRVAFVTKIHHAVADGMASAELVARSFQTGTEPVKLPAPPARVERTNPRERTAPDSTPLRMAAALWHDVARQAALPRLAARSIAAIGSAARARWNGTSGAPMAFAAPTTRFNRPLTPNRVYSHVTLPLPVLRELKTAYDCTLNDVYLALTSGVLRQYLASHDELPRRSLTAVVPASLRGPQDDPLFGNATGSWFTSLHTDLADPGRRLRAIANGTRLTRARFASGDRRLPLDWLEHWALRRVYIAGFQTAVGAVVRRPSYNVVVSNVPGPRSPLYTDGARVVEMLSLGPLTRQQGLNLTAWSYLDAFAIGIHACREHVPDVARLAEAFRPELEALQRAAPGPQRWACPGRPIRRSAAR